jgi:formylglycine-generating enzyme required for sulfatase activity
MKVKQHCHKPSPLAGFFDWGGHANGRPFLLSEVYIMNSFLKISAITGVFVVVLVSVWAFGVKDITVNIPELVRIEAGEYSYRPSGDFRIATRLVDAPIEHRVATKSFEIMRYHVTQADYAACVADSACYQSDGTDLATLPQVNVSYIDAQAYALWLSQKTSQTWRLPTDAEWVRAAGDRFHETILGVISNNADPSKLWIKRYAEEAAKRGISDPKLRPIGTFGENNLGVSDINGNVWEWTVGCQTNGKISLDGLRVLESSNYCGVRIAQGKHRAYIIDFVRDAKSGGCAVGIPPDNLGIRLVRDL